MSNGKEIPSAAGPSVSTMAVQADGITFCYGERIALDDVSFAISSGEIFAFLGPNGSGKSTLFRLLATLEPIPQGSVQVFGRGPDEDLVDLRRELGVVFQSPALDPVLTVEENLVLHGRLYGIPAASGGRRARELLERFRLADRRTDRVGTLSGGLQRRVELARSLLHRPRLLLLDEPSNGLDPGARRQYWDELERVRREHEVTVMLTTHFMEEADRCDHLALLHQGRVVARGTPAQLKAELPGDVLVLGSSRPEVLRVEIGRLLEGAQATEPVVFGPTVRLISAAAATLAPELMAALPELVDSVTVSHPTLEDVFLQRTGETLS